MCFVQTHKQGLSQTCANHISSVRLPIHPSKQAPLKVWRAPGPRPGKECTGLGVRREGGGLFQLTLLGVGGGYHCLSVCLSPFHPSWVTCKVGRARPKEPSAKGRKMGLPEV